MDRSAVIPSLKPGQRESHEPRLAHHDELASPAALGEPRERARLCDSWLALQHFFFLSHIRTLGACLNQWPLMGCVCCMTHARRSESLHFGVKYRGQPLLVSALSHRPSIWRPGFTVRYQLARPNGAVHCWTRRRSIAMLIH